MLKPLQNNNISNTTIGKNRIVLPRVASTNDYLKAKLSNSKPLPEGTVIMAVEQFSGRGQATTQWKSEPGKNLTASFLLHPSFLHPAKQFTLNIAICLAIRETLSRIINQKVEIKWPNDIYINGKKIAGILIENILQGSTWKYAIVGIGINVNQKQFPEGLKNASSLSILLHESYSIDKLLNELCICIDQQYLLLRTGNAVEQRKLYRRCLFGLNEVRSFEIDGIRVEGKIVDVDESGKLMMDFNGHIAEFGFKEIAFIL